jgi:hypothetical protein
LEVVFVSGSSYSQLQDCCRPVSAELCLEFLEHMIHDCTDDSYADDPTEGEFAEVLPTVKVYDKDDSGCSDKEGDWHNFTEDAFIIMIFERSSTLLLDHSYLCGTIDLIGPLFWRHFANDDHCFIWWSSTAKKSMRSRVVCSTSLVPGCLTAGVSSRCLVIVIPL